MAVIGGLLVELSANVARLQDDLGKAAGHVQRTERLISQSVQRVNAVFGTLGIGLSAGAIVAYGKHMVDAMDATNDLAERTGHTVEEIVGLQYVAEQSATDINKLATASNKLGSALTDKPELFRKLGIDAKTGMGAMVQLADTFATMPEGINKNALAVKLFGDRLGAEMIPFLNQGSAAIRNLISEGQRLNPLTTEQAQRAAVLNDQLDKMKFQMNGAGMQMVSTLIPGLTETARAMNELATEGHPVLALWRGLAGMGKVPWDLMFPPEDLKKSLSSANRIKELKSELAEIEAYLKRTSGRGDGIIGRWLHGSVEEQQQKATVLRNQIAALEKFGAKIDQPVAPNKPKDKPNAPNAGAEVDAVIASAQSKYDRLMQLDQSYFDDAEQKAGRKLSADLATMEAEYVVNVAKYGRNAELEALHNESTLQRTILFEQELDNIRQETARKEEEQRQNKMRSDVSLLNFTRLVRQRDYSDAMTMATNLTAGLATHSRAAFEVNKAGAIAKAVMDTYKGIGGVLAEYPGPVGWGLAAVQAAMGFAQVSAIKSTSFGGGGGGSASLPSGGGIPSQATSGGTPVVQAQSSNTTQQQPVTVNIYNTGNVLSADYVESTIIPQIKDSISNSDVLIIDPRSRQAQVLAS